MRLWHKQLIPFLCRQHLIGMWREGLGCLSIITNNKKGYAHHPAVTEWRDNVPGLLEVLRLVRAEMISRGYKPKELPAWNGAPDEPVTVRQWQSLEQQLQMLRERGCECKLDLFIINQNEKGKNENK